MVANTTSLALLINPTSPNLAEAQSRDFRQRHALLRRPRHSASKCPRRYLLSVNSASMDGNGAEARSFLCGLFCGPLASTLDDGSVGFSTRRDDPSNWEFSSIDNDR